MESLFTNFEKPFQGGGARVQLGLTSIKVTLFRSIIYAPEVQRYRPESLNSPEIASFIGSFSVLPLCFQNFPGNTLLINHLHLNTWLGIMSSKYFQNVICEVRNIPKSMLYLIFN